jgi:hypothetical protein
LLDRNHGDAAKTHAELAAALAAPLEPWHDDGLPSHLDASALRNLGTRAALVAAVLALVPKHGQLRELAARLDVQSTISSIERAAPRAYVGAIIDKLGTNAAATIAAALG